MKILQNILARIVAVVRLDYILNEIFDHFIYRNPPRGKFGPSPFRATRYARRFQILIYHKISPDAHPFFRPLDPALFEKQIAFLRDSYNILNLQELVERSQHGEIPERAVAITFDDGYRDNYTWALPVLKKYSVPATLFVTTGAIGNRQVLWYDRIFDAFRYATTKRAHLRNLKEFEVDLDSEASAKRSLELTIRRAKQLAGGARLKLVEEIEQTLQPDLRSNSRVPMLSWDEIREMQQAGVRFGSHTVTHPILSRVEKAQLKMELTESKMELEAHLKMPVVGFAYPNGQPSDYNEDVKKLLWEAGYLYAVTTNPGFNTVYQDPLELRRGQPWQKDMGLFRLKFFLQRHRREF